MEFEGEGLESGAVVGAERFGRKRAGGEGARGCIEGGLQSEELVEGREQVRGAAVVAQGSDEGVDGGDGGRAGEREESGSVEIIVQSSNREPKVKSQKLNVES